MAEKKKSIFGTDRRIKLGVWGLGRGGSFVSCCNALNIDVVAGCDFNKHIRDSFLKDNPGVFVTDNEDEFLARDLDAVLIATWFPAHAEHCIKALNAGKHVMCEVTSFMTPAEGVRLVEAVEKSGKIYNLLENYPFMKPNMMARKLWKEGFFGDFVYAEYDYHHDCRKLQYTYADGTPVEPGYELHNWRSWLNGHYYNTHSLGPVMQITGLRPVEVTAPVHAVSQPGCLGQETESPSFVKMSNGGLMRNLMGTSTCDTHRRCIWGSKAAFDLTDTCMVHVGASGDALGLELKQEWPELGELADTMGHGGGDFWELYYFAREILTGEKAPWDIYSACDVCLTGIMAVRSQHQGGIPVAIPDFRDPKVREQFRNDEWKPAHLDPKTALFPAGHDPAVTGNFSGTISKLLPLRWGNTSRGIQLIRAAYDGMKLYPVLANEKDKLAVINEVRKLLGSLDELAGVFRDARKIISAYPDSAGGKVLSDILDNAEEEKILDTEKTKKELTDWLIKVQ